MFGIIFLKISLFAFLMRYYEKRVCEEKILIIGFINLSVIRQVESLLHGTT